MAERGTGFQTHRSLTGSRQGSHQDSHFIRETESVGCVMAGPRSHGEVAIIVADGSWSLISESNVEASHTQAAWLLASPTCEFLKWL